MKKIIVKLTRILGFIYCFLHGLAFVAVLNLIVRAGIKHKTVSGLGMLVPPFLGILAGYWAGRGKFGVWRTL